MYEQINMSRDDITIYFNNAKYRFSFSNINKVIEELAKEELLNKRDKQGQLVYYNDKKVKVLPRLLEIASLEYVSLVQMKRMMIRKRLYSPVRP
jgi:CTP-dependent riboflavin kinase